MAKPTSQMVIRSLTPNITILSVPFLRYDKVKLGGRSTIVKLATGNLAVFSPVSLTDEARSTVNSLGGKVSYLIAPDVEHHLNLAPWKREFASAKVIGPEGLAEKRKEQGNEEVPFDVVFTKENKRALKLPQELADEFDVEYFDGHKNKEIVFVHRKDKTMIQADLIFNLPSTEQFSKTGEDASSGFWTRAVLYLVSTRGNGQQRFNWYVIPSDKTSLAASAKVVDAWSFDRIIPCHGDVIETGGKDVFRRMFAWYL